MAKQYSATIAVEAVRWGNCRTGCHSGLKSGVNQQSCSFWKFPAEHTPSACCRLLIAPAQPTHADSARTASVTASADGDRPARQTRAARRTDAGMAAKRKKRGPHECPPYQAHHLAYTRTRPAV